MKLIIVTGLAGSGKSVALHTLEDLGYNCIDNLPIFLIKNLVQYLIKNKHQSVIRAAVGIDARNNIEELNELLPLITTIKNQDTECQIIFLDAQTEKIIQRFSETRRKHPLDGNARSLAEAIQLERNILKSIRNKADFYIDTTYTNIHQLRDQIKTRLDYIGSKASIMLMSFGFKHGVPKDADFVFDVRCLPNPHWQQELRPLTGRDLPVINYLENCSEVHAMLTDLCYFLDRWIPALEVDGRSYLTISIGCTGGQHRSVYITESLGKHLLQKGHSILIRHRELSL